jgi:lipid II:glycine glycyltransferase (peptidoglycan interpeptide bridge formation enzyme)
VITPLDVRIEAFLAKTCVFCQPWWLDTVSPNQWDVVIVERGGEVAAALPYAYKMRLGRHVLMEMPRLTPYLGPWRRDLTSQYESRRVGEEHALFAELIHKLPKVSTFHHGFHPSVTDWLPFYWQGFEGTTHYTYVIQDLSDPDRVMGDFSHAKRKNIKRARQLVEVREDLPSREFYRHLARTLKKKGSDVAYSWEFFNRFYDACYQHQAGKAFHAVDGANNVHSAIFIVYDKKTAYYLISSIDPDFTASGSVSLLVLEAIRFLSTRTLQFDFCGSMIGTIERSSREFGGKQTPYLLVHKTPSAIVRGYRALWKLAH